VPRVRLVCPVRSRRQATPCAPVRALWARAPCAQALPAYPLKQLELSWARARRARTSAQAKPAYPRHRQVAHEILRGHAPEGRAQVAGAHQA
jgi:hypothetical protein